MSLRKIFPFLFGAALLGEPGPVDYSYTPNVGARSRRGRKSQKESDKALTHRRKKAKMAKRARRKNR